MMVPDHRAGTMLRCPRCGVELRVPGGEAKTPAANLESGPPEPLVDPARDRHQELPIPPPPLAAPPAASVLIDEATSVTPPPASTPRSIGSSSLAKSGWLPPADQAATAFYLSLLLAALALFGVAPAVWEWFELWRNPDQPPVPPWVFALLITGVMQLAYAVYLAQVPDWSALWATTIATLAAAAAWAALLGTTLLGRDESALVMLLRYADKLAGNRAAMWCFIMLCFTSVLAYFLGHTAVRWQRSYCLVRELRGV